MTWTVYTTWQAYGVVPATETSETHPNWATARRRALHLACCHGARYITVCGPDDVICGDWDAYTNRWREYPRSLAEIAA